MKMDDRSALLDDAFTKLIAYYYQVFPDSERIPVSVIPTRDLNRTHIQLRPEYARELIEKNPQADYNGRTVVPHDLDDTIHILLNSSKVLQYTKDGSMTWIGTLAHELTHAIDYYQMARMSNLDNYSLLEMASEFQMFHQWTEYHARKKGYSFLRQYFSDTGALPVRDKQIDYILNVEWPFHKNDYDQKYHQDSNSNTQMYITMQLLGRYSVWCDLFPDIFNHDAFARDFSRTTWIIDLLAYFREHENLDDAYPNFDTLMDIFRENWSL